MVPETKHFETSLKYRGNTINSSQVERSFSPYLTLDITFARSGTARNEEVIRDIASNQWRLGAGTEYSAAPRRPGQKGHQFN